ncbi:ATP-binding cassette domain-containing protein [Glaciecola sp. 1036]|uniref:ATP-binding cassette domain-containing protein n=1 Tax=Alteromonadaceae TaxID=72275 RepID=UPI003D06C496
MTSIPFHLNISLKEPNAGAIQKIEEHLLSGNLGIIGDSGAGKTSILKTMAGLLPNCLCSVTFGDLSWDNETANNPCVYVSNTFGLLTTLSVEKNLLLVHKHSRFGVKDNDFYNQIVADLGIQDLLNKPAATLSGGETQRVLIARAMLSGKPILLLDEVLSAIDKTSREIVMNVLLSWQDKYQRKFVLVSHDASDIAFFTQQCIRVDKFDIFPIQSTNSALENDLSKSLSFSILDVEFLSDLENQGLRKYRLKDSQQLIYTTYDPSMNQPLLTQRLQIPTTKILLSISEVNQIVAMNKLSGVITKIQIGKGSNKNISYVHLEVDGQQLIAVVSNYLVETLKLTPKDSVTAVFSDL